MLTACIVSHSPARRAQIRPLMAEHLCKIKKSESKAPIPAIAIEPGIKLYRRQKIYAALGVFQIRMHSPPAAGEYSGICIPRFYRFHACGAHTAALSLEKCRQGEVRQIPPCFHSAILELVENHLHKIFCHAEPPLARSA